MELLAQSIELRPDPSELRLMRAFVTRWAQRSGLAEEDSFRACLVATEAVTNAMRHGRVEEGDDHPITVACRLEGDELVLEVTDSGRFRAERDRADDHGGRGLFLIREFTRGFDLEAGSQGTRLCMRLGAVERHLTASAA